MMFINFYLLLSLLIPHTGAAVVTLYGVSATNPIPSPGPIYSIQGNGTTVYSAVKPSQGSDVTTYEVHEIRSRVLLVDRTASSTFTVLSTPTTITYTRVEGQSQLHQTILNAASIPTILPHGQFAFVDSSQNCQFDVDKKQGICVQEFRNPVLLVNTVTVAGSLTTKTAIETQTLTGTFTGTLVPIATLVTNGASRQQSRLSTNGVCTGSAAVLFVAAASFAGWI